MSFVEKLKFDERGLLPVIVQDAADNQVLMVAFTDESALKKTLETGLMHYYSRSRRKLWKKGEESGHIQTLVELRTDCDFDVLLARVEQKGGACHMGYRSCFFRKIEPLEFETDGFTEDGERLFDPDSVYGK